MTPDSAAHWYTSAEPLTYGLRDEGLETVHAGHGAVVSGALTWDEIEAVGPSFWTRSSAFIRR